MILFSLFFFVGSLRKTPVSYVFWVLWTAHYLNRSLIFPFRIRTEGKKIPILIVRRAMEGRRPRRGARDSRPLDGRRRVIERRHARAIATWCA